MNRKEIFSILALYAGKTSGVLIGVFMIPLFNSHFDRDKFGAIAIIIALQGFALIFDLGQGTLIMRSVGDLLSGRHQLRQCSPVKASENLILLFYLSFFFVSSVVLLALQFLIGLSVNWWIFLGIMILLPLLVSQNLHYTALLAAKDYLHASTHQILGQAGRAGVSLAAIIYIGNTVEIFLISQIALALVQFVAIRRRVTTVLRGYGEFDVPATIENVIGVAREGRALLLFSVAGAAVLYLDKPIVSGVLSAAEAGPYFLATTLCSVPVSVLAAPITSYFQPKIFSALASDSAYLIRSVTLSYVCALVIVMFLPSMAMVFFNEEIVALWMGGDPASKIVSSYVEILLPATAVGAFGFFPFLLLTYAKDYNFQAKMAVSLASVTLLACAYVARAGDLTNVCLVYAAYHIAALLASWLRAVYIGESQHLLSRSARITFFLPCLLAIGYVLFLMLKS